LKVFSFGLPYGQSITKYDSNFVMSRIVRTNTDTRIGCMYLDADGVIGYHQTVQPQLLLIVSGEGEVRGEKEEYVKVAVGEAVFWQQGEWHETKSSTGMTAIVIESEELDPSQLMPLIAYDRIEYYD